MGEGAAPGMREEGAFANRERKSVEGGANRKEDPANGSNRSLLTGCTGAS
jgi:hypothetical protein